MFNQPTVKTTRREAILKLIHTKVKERRLEATMGDSMNPPKRGLNGSTDTGLNLLMQMPDEANFKESVRYR